MEYFIIIFLILIILVFYRYKTHTKQLNELVKKDGWTLYLLNSCPHCVTQLQDLSTFKKYIIYDDNGNIINDGISDNNNSINILPLNQIKSFPLWYNTKSQQKIYGVQDLQTLIKPTE